MKGVITERIIFQENPIEESMPVEKISRLPKNTISLGQTKYEEHYFLLGIRPYLVRNANIF